MRLRRAAGLAFGTAFLLLSGCGGSSAPAPNPTPQISGLFPSEITAGSQSFTLFVSGAQFLSSSVVQWNGANLPTTFNSASTQLAATVPADDLQNAGVAQVTVTSPAPGGGSSLAISFTIDPAHTGGPTITSLSPTSSPLNGPAFTLTVNGTNFISGDYVTWNGGLRQTQFVSDTQLTASIQASDLTQQMIAGIAVHTSQLGIASPSVSFQVGSSPASSARFPQLVSAGPAGAAADAQSSSPAISAGGRYVAFYSQAKNLVSGAPAGNIFLRDTCLGSANCRPATVPVDVSPASLLPNAPAESQLAISADGRYVAFASTATNLLSGALAGAPQSRIFVRDVCAGASAASHCAPHNELVSVDARGNAIAGIHPAISADGRFISFITPVPVAAGSRSSNIVLVRDTCLGAGAPSGCVPQTIPASVDNSADIYVDPSAQPAISPSGRYIAFAGWTSALAASAGTKATPLSQIFLRDTCLGVSAAESCDPSTVRVSITLNGQFANAPSLSPAVSDDGRFVVFESAASNLAGNSAGSAQVYLRDTCAGPTAPFGCAPSTTLISADAALLGAVAGNYSPSISASGRYISYVAQTRNHKDASSSARSGYILVYDTCFGAISACSPHATLLSAVDSSGSASPLVGEIGVPVPVSDDGRFAAFSTRQPVAALRTSGFGDVFLTTTPFAARP